MSGNVQTGVGLDSLCNLLGGLCASLCDNAQLDVIRVGILSFLFEDSSIELHSPCNGETRMYSLLHLVKVKFKKNFNFTVPVVDFQVNVNFTVTEF